MWFLRTELGSSAKAVIALAIESSLSSSLYQVKNPFFLFFS